MNTNTPRLTPNRGAHTMHHLGIETRSHAQTLREHGLLEGTYPVKTFSELEEGDFESGIEGVESLESVVLRVVGCVEIVENSYPGCGCEMELVVVETAV